MDRCYCPAVCVVVSLGAWAVAAAGERAQPAASAPFFDATLRPFLQAYCVGCHSGKDAEHGIHLDKYQDAAAISRDRATWRKVLRMVREDKMPPADNPRPQRVERDAVIAGLQAALEQAGLHGRPDPGRVTIRRLNRSEYANTVRDLLGVEYHAVADFPSDDVGYGFDNIGDVLTLPPLLMEKYLAAAEQIAGKAAVASQPAAKPETIIRRLATRAYRRPASDREIGRLVGLFERARAAGDGFGPAMQLVVQALLVSPHFLFRVELNPPSHETEPLRLLNEYELATRLSYFLWSSMPDDELLDQAAHGRLRTDLERQVRRMLRDPKSQALVENFAGQWLQVRNLDTAFPDKGDFPNFDEDLRRAMRSEAQMSFDFMVREDRSVLELLEADSVFVNARLARHYGIPGVVGNEFRRISLKQPGAAEAVLMRGGVITLAAVLTVTSNPRRTSPVKRGKWILENILGTPPPDPPPDVPMLKDDAQAVASGSLRQRMERHRRDPHCAVCHREMDALGFALENFDAVGAWRTRDGEYPIDAAAELPDGRKFNGPRALKAVLAGRKDQFARCLAEKLLTYAIGRGVEPFDKPAVEQIVRSVADQEYKFSALVRGIVDSDPFQKRRGKDGVE